MITYLHGTTTLQGGTASLISQKMGGDAYEYIRNTEQMFWFFIDKNDCLLYTYQYQQKIRKTYPDHANGVGAPLNRISLRSSPKS